MKYEHIMNTTNNHKIINIHNFFILQTLSHGKAIHEYIKYFNFTGKNLWVKYKIILYKEESIKYKGL